MIDVTGGAIVTCTRLAGFPRQNQEHKRGTGCSHPIEGRQHAAGELMAQSLGRRLHPPSRPVTITLSWVCWAE
ncbi:hypothetical protein IG631_18275 [Alternaria alternata]|nr:hypothetical protein IG631_18275 [Alternaria alternata]